MSLLSDILAWSTQDLSPWQRDAMRRMFQKHELDPADLEDLCALVKAEYGIQDPAARCAIPLEAKHLPSHSLSSYHATLLSMHDLKNVNRIAPNQKLQFETTGITVIYGGNGSGKSGYSRVLKKACRARDQNEEVLTDAYDATAASSVPEALFDIKVNGAAKSVIWTRGVISPDELSTIAVFDSRCARSYLVNEQAIAYLPTGLDVLERLAQKVIPAIAVHLSVEIDSINTDTSQFSDLAGDTSVGKLIATLGPKTDTDRLKVLGTVTDQEKKRLAHLNKALSENDPKAKARAIRLSAQRITGLIGRIDKAWTWVNEAAFEKLKKYDLEMEAAIAAEKIAAQNFQAIGSLLPGTGETAWKNLFEAARKFSEELAYPGRPFPIMTDSQCPLCQQEVDEETAKRLFKFDEFIKQDTTQTVSEKRIQLDSAVTKINAALLDFGLDEAAKEELKQLNQTLLEQAEAFEKYVEIRRTLLLQAVKSHCWEIAQESSADPRSSLSALSAALVLDAEALEQAADESQKKALEIERNELQARVTLASRLVSLLDLLARARLKATLSKCKNSLKTKPISDKAKEFASKAVTATLKAALDKEFHALGVGHIRTKLSERVEHGKMKHQLLLELPVSANLEDILSEGEQRAIAIGSFLAELSLANHSGGVVFDDPVSSLDHFRRQKVARRLTEESKKRQIIVFTHDTSFLGELRDAIDLANVPHRMHYLEWVGNQAGHVEAGLPWEHQSFNDRIDKHEKAQRALAKNWPSYPGEADADKIRHQYNRLRSTIERAIQDVIFNGVIERYRDWVKVSNLDKVVGFSNADYQEITRLHKACCDVVDAHDPSSAKNAPVPDPHQLGQDIKALKDLVASIRSRKKQMVNTTQTLAH